MHVQAACTEWEPSKNGSRTHSHPLPSYLNLLIFMKKLLMAGVLMLGAFGLKAQTLTVINNTNCIVAYAAATNGSTSVSLTTVAPSSTAMHSAAPGSNWVSSHLQQHHVNWSPSCNGTAVAWPCSSQPHLDAAVRSVCVTAISPCNTCPVGTTFTATWTNGPNPGDAEITFN